MTPAPHPQRTRVGSVVRRCWNATKWKGYSVLDAYVGTREHVVAEVLSPTCVRTTRNHVIKSWIVISP